MSWKPMVQTGSDPQFYGNALAFATKQEAEQNAQDLMNRWMRVVDCKAEESNEPVNYTYHNRKLEAVVKETTP
jgi:hypothetical protein